MTPDAGRAVTQCSELTHPRPDSPSILPARVHDPTAQVAPFGADDWPTKALTSDPSRRYPTLCFAAWPDGFKDFGKHVAYVLLNHGVPESLVEKTNGSYVPWPAASSIASLLLRLRKVVVWLAGEWSQQHPDTPVLAPCDLDSHHLDDVRRWIGAGLSTGSRNAYLEVVVRVWHLNPWLPQDAQWPEPRWQDERWRARRPVTENVTKRIPQATLGPLLEWSVAFVTQFADDAFAATAHYNDRAQAAEARRDQPAAKAIAHTYLRQSRALPARFSADGRSLPGPSWRALAYRHELPSRVLQHAFTVAGVRLEVTSDTEVTGLDFTPTATFHGRPWIPALTVQDVEPRNHCGVNGGSRILAHLRTACLIVAAYLSGARAEEVLNWEVGAALDPVLTATGAQMHLIRGYVWKGGYADAAGNSPMPREAHWATVGVGTDALRVAERVLDALGHRAGPLFSFNGRRVSNNTTQYWIKDFIVFVNTRLAPHCADPAALSIPADEEGPISLTRMRRTLAWFIRNRPNGEVTTAIQYQHVNTTISAGYAGTKNGGLSDLLLEEDWAHRRRTLEHIRQLLDLGQVMHGPAAERAADAAQRLPRQLTASDERRLRKDPSLHVYDNPAAIALCVYDDARALCRRLETAGHPEPNLLECIDGCHNVARTEEHLSELGAQALALRQSAALAPAPLAQSLIARAQRNERIIASTTSQAGDEDC